MPVNVLDLLLAGALAGLSWTCSVVHYPLLSDLHQDGAGVVHFQRHITRIFPLVGVLMAAELMVAAWRCWADGSMATMLSLGLVLLIWAVTGLTRGWYGVATEKLAQVCVCVCVCVRLASFGRLEVGNLGKLEVGHFW